MIFVLNHLWSHVLQRATKCISLLHMVNLHTPSKITNFDDVAIFDQNIFRFDISMNETLFVQIVNPRADLDEEVERCIFAQELLFPDKVKQITFGGILQS